MPDVGIQIPPNLSDWWLTLVREGATDLGGLSANGDHISPEQPFPSPHQVRKRARAGGLRADRAAVRLSAVHRSGLDGAGRARHDQAEVLVVHPAARARAAAQDVPIRSDLVAGAIEKARDNQRLTKEELTALFAERRPEVIEDMRLAADELRERLAGETSTFVVNRNINFTNICQVGCAFCGFGQGKRSPDAYHVDRGGLRRARCEEAVDFGVTEICMQGGIHPDYTLEDYGRWLRARQGGRAARAPARVLADGGPLHVRALGPAAGGGVRVSARVRARLDAGHGGGGAPRRRARSGSRRTSCRSAAGSRSSRPRTGPACARP